MSLIRYIFKKKKKVLLNQIVHIFSFPFENMKVLILSNCMTHQYIATKYANKVTSKQQSSKI